MDFRGCKSRQYYLLNDNFDPQNRQVTPVLPNIESNFPIDADLKIVMWALSLGNLPDTFP